MALRQAARGLGAELRSGFMQLQQRRFAGDLPVKPNKYLEQWATRREHVENDFKWNGRTLSTLAIFGFGVPYVIYSTSVKEFDHVDEVAGRPKRDMWGSKA